MGRYQAATAVAVIAAKRETIRSPGGFIGISTAGTAGYTRNSSAGSIRHSPEASFSAESADRFDDRLAGLTYL